MLKLMSEGGLLMWLILLNGLVAVFVFLEKFFYFHRAQINATDFVNGIRNSLKRGNVIEAIALCDETPGPVAKVVKVGIINKDLSREEIREMMADAARVEIARLERRLVVLATIAQITPLIGFLGTVIGMIHSFKVIQVIQMPSSTQLAGGVYEALLDTAGGLVVGILAYVGYNYLVSRVQNLVLDMERGANEILNFITRRDKGESNPQ